jgi:hypothetical protein
MTNNINSDEQNINFVEENVITIASDIISDDIVYKLNQDDFDKNYISPEGEYNRMSSEMFNTGLCYKDEVSNMVYDFETDYFNNPYYINSCIPHYYSNEKIDKNNDEIFEEDKYKKIIEKLEKDNECLRKKVMKQEKSIDRQYDVIDMLRKSEFLLNDKLQIENEELRKNLYNEKKKSEKLEIECNRKESIITDLKEKRQRMFENRRINHKNRNLNYNFANSNSNRNIDDENQKLKREIFFLKESKMSLEQSLRKRDREYSPDHLEEDQLSELEKKDYKRSRK